MGLWLGGLGKSSVWREWVEVFWRCGGGLVEVFCVWFEGIELLDDADEFFVESGDIFG